jgi:oligoendopeptidase F
MPHVKWYDRRDGPIDKENGMPVSIPVKAAVRPQRRSSAPIADRWNLADLVERPVQHLDTRLCELEQAVSAIEAARPDLSPSMPSARFLELLALSERVAQGSARLGAFAYLWFSEDTKQPDARSFKSRVEERLTSLHNRLLFFELWWQGVDETNAQRLMAEAGTCDTTWKRSGASPLTR